MLPISLAEKIPKVCDRRNSGNDFLERSADSRERVIRNPVIPAQPQARRRLAGATVLRCASQHCCAIVDLGFKARASANRTSGLLAAANVLVGGRFDWIISAGVISRAFATGAVVVQNADPSARPTKRTNAQDRQAKAGNGNRTRMASLEGWNFTIKLCPREK